MKSNSNRTNKFDSKTLLKLNTKATRTYLYIIPKKKQTKSQNEEVEKINDVDFVLSTIYILALTNIFTCFTLFSISQLAILFYIITFSLLLLLFYLAYHFIFIHTDGIIRYMKHKIQRTTYKVTSEMKIE